MDKQQAQNIVKATFENPFDKGRFTQFVKNLLNSIEEAPFSYKGNLIPDAYEQYISSLERIGKYADGEHKIDILVVKLKKETSIERARTMQRNFIAWYLNGSRGGEMKDAALVAFVAPNEEDRRFSLVKMDYRFEEGKDGKIKVKEEFTPARRWSFLVGKNENSHTAQSRLVPIIADDTHNLTLAQLEEAFNIEKVTKEFFEKYRELFLRTDETLDEVVSKDKIIQTDFEAKGINTVDFSKKLLGQIVFLYFLQKKGWFGVERDADWGTGPKPFLRELFESKHEKYKNFFNDILEPLFYEALARERDDDFYSRFNCKIPFLNGGLFELLNNYDWVHTDILLPNELFSNTHKTKEGDTGNGILDIFDRYNFTVKEDEPLEKEVAVDPQMLGKVFENLLAVKDRKSKGTYYTPREIVHYMCQQSLINYLHTELTQTGSSYEKIGEPQLDMLGNEAKKGQLDLIIQHPAGQIISKEDIETLIKYGEQVGENEATVEAKGRETDTYSYKLPESIRQNARVIDEKLANIKICDPAIGSGAFPVGMMSEIVKTRNVLSAFIHLPLSPLEGGSEGGLRRTIYRFKRECIEKSLYGVDIDPGAVEIAKLRLWLSLVVDEEDIKQIKPLPNLDYKIVAGNSLLGFPFKSQKLGEIEKLKEKLFDETDHAKKAQLKAQVDKLLAECFAASKKSLGYEVNFDFGIMFSEVFREKGGFDVVIGNPPYVVSNDKVLREIYKESVYGRPNLYGFFIHRSLGTVLSGRGVLTFINPRTLLADAYCSALRRYVLKHGTVSLVLNIVDRRNVFETVLQSTIVNLFSRDTTPDTVRVKSVRTKEEITARNEIKIKKADFLFGSQDDPIFIVAESEGTYSIFRKLAKLPTFSQVGLAFTTGKVQWDLYKKVLSPNPNKSATRLVWAENIQRFYFAEARLRSDKLFINGTLKNGFPIPHQTIAVQRTTAVEQPFRIIATVVNPADLGFPIQLENGTSYLDENTKGLDLNLVLGILDSRLLDFVFRHINSNTHVSAGELNGLPFPDIANKRDVDSLIKLVDRILAITKDEDYPQNPAKKAQVKALEQEIDQMVYQLYDLTPEEIAIVEKGRRE